MSSRGGRKEAKKEEEEGWKTWKDEREKGGKFCICNVVEPLDAFP